MSRKKTYIEGQARPAVHHWHTSDKMGAFMHFCKDRKIILCFFKQSERSYQKAVKSFIICLPYLLVSFQSFQRERQSLLQLVVCLRLRTLPFDLALFANVLFAYRLEPVKSVKSLPLIKETENVGYTCNSLCKQKSRT